MVLTAFPARRRHLSEGVLVEAYVLARVLGIRLLTLDATIALAPADVTAPSSVARRSPVHTSLRSSDGPARSPAAAGPGLAEAVRTINEAAELLAETRR